MGNGIPENINIEDTWIDVDTLAKLKNITKRVLFVMGISKNVA